MNNKEFTRKRWVSYSAYIIACSLLGVLIVRLWTQQDMLAVGLLIVLVATGGITFWLQVQADREKFRRTFLKYEIERQLQDLNNQLFSPKTLSIYNAYQNWPNWALDKIDTLQTKYKDDLSQYRKQEEQISALLTNDPDRAEHMLEEQLKPLHLELKKIMRQAADLHRTMEKKEHML